MSTKQKNKGFTIIEVVLVLAIAGLIFMMVFVALPALQRNQRDTARKNDVGRAITAIVSYSSANRGNIPTSADLFNNTLVPSYLKTAGDTFIDPAGANTGQATPFDDQYQFVSNANAGSTLVPFDAGKNQNVIYFSVANVCSTTTAGDVTAGGSRKVALRIVLEGGGVYCTNN